MGFGEEAVVGVELDDWDMLAEKLPRFCGKRLGNVTFGGAVPIKDAAVVTVAAAVVTAAAPETADGLEAIDLKEGELFAGDGTLS